VAIWPNSVLAFPNSVTVCRHHSKRRARNLKPAETAAALLCRGAILNTILRDRLNCCDPSAVKFLAKMQRSAIGAAWR
jgi:hypothetical protein